MIGSTVLRRTLAAGVALSALAVAAPSFAAEDTGTLGEVIVTAQKRLENINDVPVSVTAVGGEKLNVIRSSGGDIRVLSARIPSVTLESSFGRTFPRPYIRGLGNTDFDLNASQPVSFVYDDVVLENPILKGFPLFDIGQVEALRGPQGTLFGRNTPAGVLKFDSVKPGQTPGGYIQASHARFNTTNLEGAVGGPLQPNGILSVRLSGLYQYRSDWIDNGFTNEKDATGGYEEYALRGQMLFKPSDKFSALLNVHYLHLDGTPQLFRANIIKKGTNEFVSGFNRGVIYMDAQRRAFQKVKEQGASLKITADLGGPELTSITGYEHVTTLSRGDIDGGYGAVFAPPSGPGFIPFPSESADGMPYHGQLSQEVRLAQTIDKFSYTVGGFYFFEDVKIDSFDYATLAGGALDGYAYQHQKTTSWAVFGNADYKLTPQWTVGGGLRYSNDDKDFLARRLISPIGGGSTPVLRTAPTSDDVSFNANTTYALDDQVNLYARVSKGYRAPSIQGRLLFGDTLSIAGKETLMSYETGVKGDVLSGKLRYDADVFYYRVKDLQVTAVGGGANFNRLLNAKHAEGYGFEFNAEAEPVSHLLLTAGLSYNHTEIKDPTLFTAPCGGGCTVLSPAGPLPGTVLINGNSLPNAPRWIANFTGRYAIPVGSGEVFAFTDWAYRSKVNFFLYKSAEFTDDRLLEVGLRVGYKAAGGKWEAALFGRNIFNNRSLEGGIDFDNLTGFVNDPATYGAEIKASF